MSKVFFDDPMVLFKKDEVFKMWPSPKMSLEERINASARFIIFASCALYLYNRDTRVFIVGLICIGVLYFMFNKKISEPKPPCQLPTADNPMANFLQNEWNTRTLPSCDYDSVKPLVHNYVSDRFIHGNTRSRAALPEHQRYAAARQWVMTPARDNPNAQAEFAEACYGKKFQPLCRDNPSMCDPNFRGAQLEAFAGLDPSGTGRMHGGGSIKYS